MINGGTEAAYKCDHSSPEEKRLQNQINEMRKYQQELESKLEQQKETSAKLMTLLIKFA